MYDYSKGVDPILSRNIRENNNLGSWRKINPQILRGILVRIQGASKVAYFTYSAFDATQNTGQKTIKIVDLFFSMTLNIRKGSEMGDKGKKDKGKREHQKKSQNTLKEKRKQKKEKTKSIWGNGR